MNHYPCEINFKKNGYVGIDPGKQGAVALLVNDEYFVEDWPGDPAPVVDLLKSWRSQYNILLCGLERVSAMPGQGVVSMFSFGQNLGMWQGILAALKIPYLMPTPQKWQKGLIDGKAAKDPKMKSLITARRLFPKADLSLKKHHGRADALLIAYWAINQMIPEQ